MSHFSCKPLCPHSNWKERQQDYSVKVVSSFKRFTKISVNGFALHTQSWNCSKHLYSANPTGLQQPHHTNNPNYPSTPPALQSEVTFFPNYCTSQAVPGHPTHPSLAWLCSGKLTKAPWSSFWGTPNFLHLLCFNYWLGEEFLIKMQGKSGTQPQLLIIARRYSWKRNPNSLHNSGIKRKGGSVSLEALKFSKENTFCTLATENSHKIWNFKPQLYVHTQREGLKASFQLYYVFTSHFCQSKPNR